MGRMSFLDAIILGIVEGATEFLPVSSTGHVILVSKLLGIESNTFSTTFTIAVQLGAILAVLLLYWRSFLDQEVVKRVLVAFLPTAIIGFTLYPLIKGYLLTNPYIVVTALLLGGIALIIFELFHQEHEGGAGTPADITYRQALTIGLAQSVAIVPGVSRSAASIVGGLALGIRRVAIVEFSFLLAVPTMAAATGLDLIKSYGTISTADYQVLLVGMLVSFAVALLALKTLRAYVAKYTFIPFGIYRIGVALLFFLFVL
jgi:undecaprenyl-diphosphatase